MDQNQRQALDIQQDALWRYTCLSWGLSGLILWGIGVLITVVIVYTIGQRWIHTYVDSIRYELGQDTVWIHWAFLWKVEKSIPLSKITDVKIVQGPIQRLFGIKSLYLQTAGNGASALAEGRLRALIAPEAVRDQLIQRINELQR